MLILFIDLPGLLKVQAKQRRKVAILYGIIVLADFSLGLLLILDRAPLSPTEVIARILNLVLGI